MSPLPPEPMAVVLLGSAGRRRGVAAGGLDERQHELSAVWRRCGYCQPVGNSPKTVRFRAVAFSHLVQSRSLDWPTPMNELMKDPSKGDFVWRRLQYVFGLPDPRSLTPAAARFTEDERELLARFVAQAKKLAATSLLSAEDIVRINIPDFGVGEDVESEFSDPDVTAGFMVFLRQCYADSDEASFSKCRKVIEHRLSEAGDTGSLDVGKRWRKAHAALKNQALEELVQEQLIAEQRMPAQTQNPDGHWESAVVRAPAAPSELLLTFWYGDQLHWGRNRDALRALQADPFESAMWDIAARQAALDFAHFYLGFALLVDAVLAAALGS
jgi:hypothetical protein